MLLLPAACLHLYSFVVMFVYSTLLQWHGYFPAWIRNISQFNVLKCITFSVYFFFLFTGILRLCVKKVCLFHEWTNPFNVIKLTLVFGPFRHQFPSQWKQLCWLLLPQWGAGATAIRGLADKYWVWWPTTKTQGCRRRGAQWSPETQPDCWDLGGIT